MCCLLTPTASVIRCLSELDTVKLKTTRNSLLVKVREHFIGMSVRASGCNTSHCGHIRLMVIEKSCFVTRQMIIKIPRKPKSVAHWCLLPVLLDARQTWVPSGNRWNVGSSLDVKRATHQNVTWVHAFKCSPIKFGPSNVTSHIWALERNTSHILRWNALGVFSQGLSTKTAKEEFSTNRPSYLFSHRCSTSRWTIRRLAPANHSLRWTRTSTACNRHF